MDSSAALAAVGAASAGAELYARSFIQGPTPKLASGIGYVVVFSVLFAVNMLSCVFYHQWWFLGSWGVGLVLEIVGYAGRIWYTLNDNSSSAYIMELVCITVAPCFLMAGIYYVLAQLILIFGNDFSRLKPMQYSLIFIICDVISIFVQAAGGGVSDNPSSSTIGRYIMIAGLAFQVFTISVFQVLWYDFLWKIYNTRKLHGDTLFNPKFPHIRARPLLTPFIWGVSLVVILIYTRSIYRLIETSSGWESYLSTNEIYFNILEGVMVSVAALIMATLSPGFVYGRHAHLYIKKDSYSSATAESDGRDEADETLIEAETKGSRDYL